MPLRLWGRITRRAVPHRVPPNASAASQFADGTWTITARVTDVMIGMIISESTTPTTNSELP